MLSTFEEGMALGLGAGALGGLLILVYALVVLMALVQYVLNGIAMLRLAKKTGVPNGWLAFIPIGDIYLLGKIAEAGNAKKHVKRLMISYCIYLALALVYVFVAIANVLLLGEGSLGGAVAVLCVSLLMLAGSIVYAVFAYIALYRVCENFDRGNALGWFLGMLLGSMFCSSLVEPILLLILSAKTPAVSQAPKVTVTPPPTDSVF